MRYYFLKGMDIKRLIFLAIFIVQAIILTFVEAAIPAPAGLHGLKPGLAGIFTVAALVFFSFSDTLAIILIRCVAVSLFTGGPVIFLFSVCGGVLSAVVMWIMLKTMKNIFSLTGISIAGAIAHNTGQIMVACFVMSDLTITAYLPVLLISGIFTGCFIGICSTFLVRFLKKLNLIENI